MSAANRQDGPVTAGEAQALFAPLANESRLVVAVSGGPDSVALLALLYGWAGEGERPQLRVATIDHGLRPGSAREASMVAALCEQLGLPHATLTWAGPKPAARLQERARQARYDLLATHAMALGGCVIVTAHTLDDQAETVLMRMAHGSGPAGLAGMQVRLRKGDVEIARPLLTVSKARLVATVEALGLDVVHDPANGDPRFDRARWRALMPLLAQEGLSAQRLCRLAQRIARMDAAVTAQVAQALSETLLPARPDAVRLRFSALLAWPDEIVLRVVAAALEQAPLAALSEARPRLERIEACVSALAAAGHRRAALTRTLSGCVLALGGDGVLSLMREPPRRRNVHSAA